ncbi:hypothetical protein STCU_09952 [Strigomonas culicis]|uniref:Uncharacterized protein n=1 Tax=Strigomonas culicis TaxID=28005 RepID=S9UVC9_9TRYP|nr:hypothetical protein STCU_09952 [Strigomonas culicis]|eukprot:EPY18466.1 hypothetical protein STCU_09952 [Strigomonas culicis]
MSLASVGFAHVITYKKEPFCMILLSFCSILFCALEEVSFFCHSFLFMVRDRGTATRYAPTRQVTLSTAHPCKSFDHAQHERMEHHNERKDPLDRRGRGGSEGGTTKMKQEGRLLGNTTHFKRSASHPTSAPLSPTNCTVAALTPYTSSMENNSFTTEQRSADGTEMGSTNTSIIDAALRNIDDTPYDVDPFACTMTTGIFRRTASLYLDDASVSSAGEEGEDTATEENKTMEVTDCYGSRSPLRPAMPMVQSMSAVEVHEPHHAISNEAPYSRTCAQNMHGKTDKKRNDEDRDVDGEKQGKRRWSMWDLQKSVDQQIRALLPSKNSAHKTAGTKSSAAEDHPDKLISETIKQATAPIESSALPDPKRHKERADAEDDTAVGGGLLISSITKRATIPCSSKAATEPEDAPPASPLRRDAQAQLAKWKKSVTHESACRRSVNENTLEGSCRRLGEEHSTRNGGTPLQSSRADGCGWTSRSSRMVRVICSDEEWAE